MFRLWRRFSVISMAFGNAFIADNDFNIYLPTNFMTFAGHIIILIGIVIFLPILFITGIVRIITRKKKNDPYWYGNILGNLLTKIEQNDTIMGYFISNKKLIEKDHYFFCKWFFRFYNILHKCFPKEYNLSEYNIERFKKIMDEKYEEYMIIRLAGLEE